MMSPVRNFLNEDGSVSAYSDVSMANWGVIYFSIAKSYLLEQSEARI